MKHLIIFVLLTFGLVFSAFGQDRGRGRAQVTRPQPEAVTVSGNLIVSNGLPALTSGDVTYLTAGIGRLAGFIDGLQEGAYVSIEGYAINSPQDETVKFLRPVTLSLDGRTFDMSRQGERSFSGMPHPYGHRGRICIPHRRSFF